MNTVLDPLNYGCFSRESVQCFEQLLNVKFPSLEKLSIVLAEYRDNLHVLHEMKDPYKKVQYSTGIGFILLPTTAAIMAIFFATTTLPFFTSITVGLSLGVLSLAGILSLLTIISEADLDRKICKQEKTVKFLRNEIMESKPLVKGFCQTAGKLAKQNWERRFNVPDAQPILRQAICDLDLLSATYNVT